MPFKPKERQYRSIVGIQDYAQEDAEYILRGSPIVFDRETVLWKDSQGREYLEKSTATRWMPAIFPISYSIEIMG